MKIKYITVKEDGSLIAFMNLPNGKVFAKNSRRLRRLQILTQEQIDGILIEISTYAQDISTIYTSLVESFQAN